MICPMRLVFLLATLLISATAMASFELVATVNISPAPGKPKVDASLLRARREDGGIELSIRLKGQTTSVYSSGGDDDGPSDKDVRSVSVSPFSLPGGKKILRIDMIYRAPDATADEENGLSVLVAIDDKPSRMVEIETVTRRKRSKTCREITEIALAAQDRNGGTVLVATTGKTADPALGDDDLPIDKTCKAPPGKTESIYRLVGGKFIDTSRRAAPPKPTPAAATDDDDEG